MSRSAKAPAYWLRFDDEASSCPACASPRIVPVDEFRIPKDARRRRVRLISGCRDCGLLFSNPQPRSEQVTAFYGEGGEWAARHAERLRWLEAKTRRSPSGKKRQKARGKRDVLFDAIAPYAPVHTPPSGASVLDFGCGDGKMLDWLQRRGWETYGIEPSMDVAFIRHQRLSSLPQDQRFGLIILNHVLEHMADPLGLLNQLAGALRDDGALFVSVPGVDALAAAPRSSVLREWQQPSAVFLGNMSAWFACSRGSGSHDSVRFSGAGRCVHEWEATSASPPGRENGAAARLARQAAGPCHSRLGAARLAAGRLSGTRTSTPADSITGSADRPAPGAKDGAGMNPLAAISRRRWTLALAALLVLAAAFVDIAIIPPRVTVRWRDDLTAVERVALEQRSRLESRRLDEGATWRYD